MSSPPRPTDTDYRGPTGDLCRSDGPIRSKNELFQILDYLHHTPTAIHHMKQRLSKTNTSLWSDPHCPIN
ncbi:MAG: hypothetical protein ACYC26_10135 [Phycisphaerales bacterium]